MEEDDVADPDAEGSDSGDSRDRVEQDLDLDDGDGADDMDDDGASSVGGGRKSSVVSLGRRQSAVSLLGRKPSMATMSRRKSSIGRRASSVSGGAWGINNSDQTAMLRAANLKVRCWNTKKAALVWPFL